MKRRKSGPRFRIGTGDRFAYQGCTAALWALADLAEVIEHLGHFGAGGAALGVQEKPSG